MTVLGTMAGAAPAAGVGEFTAPEVVVSATRGEARERDLPVAIDRIDARRIREDNALVNLSESLDRVQGVTVRNRQNYAQDLQVSSRGFGARAAFGVRGVRLVADGIPATTPDGQGQTATFSLATLDRIEVLRGPFAALYGNASGALVQTFTRDGPREPTLAATSSFGSFGARRIGIEVGGTHGAGNALAEISRFESDGYRDHSRVVREQMNARLRFALDGGGSVALAVNALEQPDTLDPLGLTRADMRSNPRQAVGRAVEFNTRKSVSHRQGGVVLTRPLGDGATLRVSAYAGAREVVQFLAIPLGAQLLPTAAGGVVDLDRDFAGMSVQHEWRRPVSQGELRLTFGLEHDRMDERRRGYVNDLGVAGALKRDQDDRVTASDLYVIGEWSTGRWVLAGGARESRVRFQSADRFVVPGNPDDSGGARYTGRSVAAGVLHKLSRAVHVYANAGRGFETPTLAELAYRPGGATGLNLALRPAQSTQVEAGIKIDTDHGDRVRLAVFDARTEDEIVVNASAGGRTDFRNAGRTQRKGIEAAWESEPVRNLELSVAWTWIDARYRDAFVSGSPPALVAAGNRLPGVARSTLFAEAAWRHPRSGFRTALEMRRADAVPVDDVNSEAADGYTVLNLRAGFEQRRLGWRAAQFVRIDNVADRSYAGSVIVGEANRRFYEPAPRRNLLVGVEVAIGL